MSGNEFEISAAELGAVPTARLSDALRELPQGAELRASFADVLRLLAMALITGSVVPAGLDATAATRKGWEILSVLRAAAMEVSAVGRESSTEPVQRDVAEIKRDICEIKKTAKAGFRILIGALITMLVGLAGVMAKGFHWL